MTGLGELPVQNAHFLAIEKIASVHSGQTE